MTKVTIYSATKLESSVQASLTSYVEREFGTKSPFFELDPSLIAGIRIVGGSRQIELSLSDLLDTLGESLT